MLGIVIYIVIQIALAVFAIYILANREEIRAKHAHKKDKPWEKIFIVLFVPIASFAYFSMGGFPPKSDQIVSMTVTTLVMYAAVILRWRRQARIGIEPPPAPPVKQYFYRSTDGREICGPVNEARLSALVRMGFITTETLVADQATPEDWKPLRVHQDLASLG